MPTEEKIYPDNCIFDLEKGTAYPEFYPAIQHSMSAVQAVPFIKDLMYFKTQMLRNEIVDC